MRRAQVLKVARKAENDPEERDEIDDEIADETMAGGCQLAAFPMQVDTPGVSDVQPPGYHCGNPHNEPSVEPDRIGEARARPAIILTEGSKALAMAFWKALGFESPLQIPPELAGIDYRAVLWEQAGWPRDLIDSETRRFASDRPPKPISYFEKVFATAFARRQAPLPVVNVRDAEQLTVTRHGTHGNGIIQAADRLIDKLRSFDDDGTGRTAAEDLRSGALAPPVRLLPQGGSK
jgi:hypothetical protein